MGGKNELGMFEDEIRPVWLGNEGGGDRVKMGRGAG